LRLFEVIKGYLKLLLPLINKGDTPTKNAHQN